MKAKTKRRITHLLIKKQLVKKRTSRRLIRAVFILIATVSTGSLAYAIAVTKPVVGVAIHSSGPDGRLISAPVQAAAAAANNYAVASSGLTGRGSWYAWGLQQPDAITCASRIYPRGSQLEVTNLRNGHKVVCRVNDYGPEAWTGRIIDLSRGSFEQVDSLGTGTIPVSIRPVVAGS